MSPTHQRRRNDDPTPGHRDEEGLVRVRAGIRVCFECRSTFSERFEEFQGGSTCPPHIPWQFPPLDSFSSESSRASKGRERTFREFQGNAREDSKHNKTGGGTRREIIRRVLRVFSSYLNPPLRERRKCRRR